jgi:hypothetical protein
MGPRGLRIDAAGQTFAFVTYRRRDQQARTDKLADIPGKRSR